MASAIHDLIQGLEALGNDGFRDEDVRRLLLGGPTLDDLERYLWFQPERYTRNLVYRNRHFEVLALCWPPGSASKIHDHGGQRCWFRVESGSFDVVDYDVLAGAREPGFARVVSRGLRVRMNEGCIDYKNERDEIHCVAVAPGSEPAVSLHVYAAPVESFLVYDPAAEWCTMQQSRYDAVPGSRRAPFDAPGASV